MYVSLSGEKRWLCHAHARAVAVPLPCSSSSSRPLVQMLGEGIALSSLPLYLTRLGATPIDVALAISFFSLFQMVGAPVLVGTSTRFGRSLVLRICLAGAAAASLLIALSGSVYGSVYGVIAGRALAGVFAACVPVAQAGVTDILPREQASLGLSRVSAAAQTGVVVGPAASAIFQEGFAVAGLSADRCLPAVFVMAAACALSVLAQMATLARRRRGPTSVDEGDKVAAAEVAAKEEAAAAAEAAHAASLPPAPALAQPMLRTITIVIGWTAILSNSIYGLFAPRFMGFQQAQLR